MFRNRRGFTLVELLVVIAIIGVLVALLLPAVQAAREAARRTHCSNNLKQLGLALHNYHDTHQVWPPGEFHWPNVAGSTGRGDLSHWAVQLLPFLELSTIYDQFDFTVRGNHANNRHLWHIRIAGYLCPSAPSEREFRAGTVPPEWVYHYQGVCGARGTNAATGQPYPETNRQASGSAIDGGGASIHGYWGTNGAMPRERALGFRDITDGTSNTFAMGELSWEANDKPDAPTQIFVGWVQIGGATTNHNQTVIWPIHAYSASNGLLNEVSFGSEHPGGTHFLMCDGSVRFISETIDHATYLSSASRNGKESLSVSN